MVKKWLHQTFSLATVCIVLHLATSPSDARAGRLGPSRRHFPHASRVAAAISAPRLAISPPRLAISTPRLVTNMTTSSSNHLLLPFDGNRLSQVSKNKCRLTFQIKLRCFKYKANNTSEGAFSGMGLYKKV